MRDKILLPAMQFTVCHGFYPSEKEIPQSFTVSLDMALDLQTACRTDCLTDTLDYGAVYQEVKDIMTGPPVNLIEHLAGNIANVVLHHPQVAQVVVRVQKDEVALGDVSVPAAVEITRVRQG